MKIFSHNDKINKKLDEGRCYYGKKNKNLFGKYVK